MRSSTHLHRHLRTNRSNRMRTLPLFTTTLLFLFASHAVESANPSKVGVCHGRVGDNLPPPSAVVRLLQSNKISKVRLFKPDPDVLRAFRGSGIELMIGVPNENLTSLSAPDAVGPALDWIKSNVLAFVPADQVRYLAVGNEVLYKDPFYTPHLMPAMWNLHRALQSLGLDGRIKLSSPHASSVLGSSSPPSAGGFDPYVLPIIRQMLGFLSETGAPFMVNLYPFFSYLGDPVNVPLGIALFLPDAPPIHDGGIAYTNMFDATVDAVVAAMEREGFPGIPVAVTETGWPTAGSEGASAENAAAYNGRIVERAMKGEGTPRRPGVPVEVFLFDLYNENGKDGGEFEKHFGIFNSDGSKNYNINFV